MTRSEYVLKNGMQKMEVTLSDLNGYPDNLRASWMSHNREADYESKKEKNKSFEVEPYISGYQSYNKESGIAEVSALIANRFSVVIIARGIQDIDLLREYLESLPIDRMGEIAQQGTFQNPRGVKLQGTRGVPRVTKEDLRRAEEELKRQQKEMEDTTAQIRSEGEAI